MMIIIIFFPFCSVTSECTVMVVGMIRLWLIKTYEKVFFFFSFLVYWLIKVVNNNNNNNIKIIYFYFYLIFQTFFSLLFSCWSLLSRKVVCVCVCVCMEWKRLGWWCRRWWWWFIFVCIFLLFLYDYCKNFKL